MHSHRVSLSDMIENRAAAVESLGFNRTGHKAGQDFQECQTDFTSGAINSVEMFCGQIYTLYLCLSLLPLRLAHLYCSNWRASAKLS